MLITKQEFYYWAFGLYIKSNIQMEELPRLQELTNLDLEINIKKVQSLTISSSEYEFINDGDTVIFHVPEVVTFYMDYGKTINAECLQSSDMQLIKLYILGTCMGIILLQREILPLHGSLIEINGKAYAFVGHSGAGKSTLASSFINQGYKLVSDDLIAVTLKDGQPWVVPSYPQQKLWQESLNIFGMERSGYDSIYGREEKYCIPINSHFYSEPLPLGGIFELVKADQTAVEIRSIPSLNRFHLLFTHTYRNFLLHKLNIMDWHFSLSTEIIPNIITYQIQRPIVGVTVGEITELILKTIKSGE
ncbi:aldolase [Robertmurraya sp. FSL R5-0851]|uniref:aldolase n=1 Tax=Robertmurraya sp. FSL R5-0851 TaxID=2921584 RepID=UPI0030F9078C